MSKVFALEKHRDLDCSQAEMFGDVTFLFEGKGQRTSFWDSNFVRDIDRELRSKMFDFEKDYVLIYGNVNKLAIFISTLVSSYGTINVLMFDSTSRTYVPRTIGDHYGDVEGRPDSFLKSKATSCRDVSGCKES